MTYTVPNPNADATKPHCRVATPYDSHTVCDPRLTSQAYQRLRPASHIPVIPITASAQLHSGFTGAA